MKKRLWMSFTALCIAGFSMAASANGGPNCTNVNNSLAWLQQPPQRVLYPTTVHLQAESVVGYSSATTANWQEWVGTPASFNLLTNPSSTWTYTGGSPYRSQSDTLAETPTANNAGNIWGFWQVVSYTLPNGDPATTCIGTVLYVQNNAPTAAIVNVAWPQVNASTGFLGGGTIDPLAQNSQLSYTWDFGDGSAAGIGQSVSHTYASTGTYTVTLQTNDGYFTASTTRQIKVVNESLAAATVPWNIAIGIQ